MKNAALFLVLASFLTQGGGCTMPQPKYELWRWKGTAGERTVTTFFQRDDSHLMPESYTKRCLSMLRWKRKSNESWQKLKNGKR